VLAQNAPEHTLPRVLQESVDGRLRRPTCNLERVKNLITSDDLKITTCRAEGGCMLGPLFRSRSGARSSSTRPNA
jgi:hypothetical protein